MDWLFDLGIAIVSVIFGKALDRLYDNRRGTRRKRRRRSIPSAARKPPASTALRLASFRHPW
jgi:hypothetical protein